MTCKPSPFEETLNLCVGHPDPNLLPRKAIAEACAQAAQDSCAGEDIGLEYCDGYCGSEKFQNEFVAFLSRQCPLETPPLQAGILLTNGVSHGLDLACTTFAKPGDAILVETPTYFLAMSIFESHGLVAVPAPMDCEGIVVDAMEDILKTRISSNLPQIRFIYTIPSNHNPTGVSMTPERRKELVSLARRWNLLIFADEVYHLLDWHPDGERPARMVCFDEAYTSTSEPESAPLPVVLSVNSFSKILSPGLRAGWIEAAPCLIRRLASGYIISGGCVTTFITNAILVNILASRAADNALAAFIAEYKRRADCLSAALDMAHLTPFVRPMGGFFAWVPLEVDAKAVHEFAISRHGVTFLPGSRCDATGSSDQCARFCFAMLSPREIQEAVRRFACAVAEVATAEKPDKHLD